MWQCMKKYFKNKRSCMSGNGNWSLFYCERRPNKKNNSSLTGHLFGLQRNNIECAQVVLEKWKRQESGKNLDEFLVKWFEKERRNRKPKYLEGCRISWNFPMFVVHRWNIQSGKVQIYAATEFFKSHSTEMGVDMQIDRASIHLLSPSTTSTQPES